MAFGDLAKALAQAAVAVDGGMIHHQRIAAYVLAFKTGTPTNPCPITTTRSKRM
jgi:hypothetical protein